MNKKYELAGETKNVGKHTLRRIRALTAIGTIALPGDLGGWIESEANLSQDGDSWVYDDAVVLGGARVYSNARVYGDAMVCGNARVSGAAQIYGDAHVKRAADYMVFKNSWSSGRWFTYTRSNGMWKVGCFRGSGNALVKKAYKDSELSGRCCAAIVRAVEEIEKEKGEVL